ncbi:hypothetical protein [Natronobiforma cellulositropha]|uniref:hypothetical protein n=1 Tax=Natronobiforma cellulositropha TaxID=1679076 RepID=UPI0021D612DA|nr:hypothetical protein [Natronobiforma cellulositropha]
MSRDRDDEIEIEVETDRDEASERHERAPMGSPYVDDDAAERALEDELGRIDLLTTPEGYVEGRVSGLTSLDESTVELEVRLPHDALVTFTLEKPIPWSSEYLFARIVEDVGYDAASVGHLVGEPVYVTRADREEEAASWLEALGWEDLLESLGPYVGYEPERTPQWRLVDPLERPDPPPEGLSTETVATLGTGAVLLGVVAAVVGAIVGVTGGVVLSSAVLAYALPGLVLVLVGLYALATRLEY